MNTPKTLGASLVTLLIITSSSHADPDKAVPKLTRDQPIVFQLEPGFEEDSFMVYTPKGWQHVVGTEGKALEFEGKVLRAGQLEDHTAFVLLDTGQLMLRAPKDEAWTTRALPEALSSTELASVQVAGGADNLVLLQAVDAVYLWKKDHFEKVELSKPPENDPGIMGWPNHLLRDGSGLLVGYDRGEWGGALLRIDLEKGTWRQIEQPGSERGYNLPVQALRRAPDGVLYAVLGLAHLGLRNGVLLRSTDDGRFETLVYTDAYDKALTKNWTHDATNFNDIAFDDQGRLYLLTGVHGVFRLEGDTWMHKTPSWSEFVYVSRLMLRGNTAVIAANDAGLVFWDLNSDTWQRATLRP